MDIRVKDEPPDDDVYFDVDAGTFDNPIVLDEDCDGTEKSLPSYQCPRCFVDCTTVESGVSLRCPCCKYVFYCHESYLLCDICRDSGHQTILSKHAEAPQFWCDQCDSTYKVSGNGHIRVNITSLRTMCKYSDCKAPLTSSRSKFCPQCHRPQDVAALSAHVRETIRKGQTPVCPMSIDRVIGQYAGAVMYRTHLWTADRLALTVHDLLDQRHNRVSKFFSKTAHSLVFECRTADKELSNPGLRPRNVEQDIETLRIQLGNIFACYNGERTLRIRDARLLWEGEVEAMLGDLWIPGCTKLVKENFTGSSLCTLKSLVATGVPAEVLKTRAMNEGWLVCAGEQKPIGIIHVTRKGTVLNESDNSKKRKRGSAKGHPAPPAPAPPAPTQSGTPAQQLFLTTADGTPVPVTIRANPPADPPDVPPADPPLHPELPPLQHPSTPVMVCGGQAPPVLTSRRSDGSRRGKNLRQSTIHEKLNAVVSANERVVERQQNPPRSAYQPDAQGYTLLGDYCDDDSDVEVL